MTDKYKELREAIEQLKNKPSYEAVDRFRANSGITDIVALLAERDALRDALKINATLLVSASKADAPVDTSLSLEENLRQQVQIVSRRMVEALGEEQQ